MDSNKDLKQFIDNIKDIRRNNTFFKDFVSLNASNQFDINDTKRRDEKTDQMIGPEGDVTTGSAQEMSCNLVDRDLNRFSDSSLQVLDDYRMDTCLTPSLQTKANVSQRNKLFAFHNKKQLFVNNFCLNENSESKENMDIDNNYVNNTLGLSPLKSHHIQSCLNLSQSLSKFSLPDLNINETIDSMFGQKSIQTNGSMSAHSLGLNSIQFNTFSSNDPQLGTNSLVLDETFKSLSKCSDLDLREEPEFDFNQTFRSPNSNFDNKSIDTYFRQLSEPISFGSSSDSALNSHQKPSINSKLIKTDFSLMNESFASISDEIDLSNNTLEIAQKIIDRKNRKRKSMSTASMTSSDETEISFTPSVNSTLNSSEDMSDKVVKSKDDVSSGFGTLSAVTQQTHRMPDSRSIQTISSLNVNTLSLNQMLFVSPNILSLTIGCFVNFKLNYLKIKNLSITSFLTEVKLKANIDTLNSLDIEYPKQLISIPAFFEGLLTDKISITPLKSGYFQIIFEIYPKIENINLPISPMSVICNIRAEELVIKRTLYTSDTSLIEYNLFEDKHSKRQILDLFVSNKQITNEIPLKLILSPNHNFMFEPIHRQPESSIHSFRCLDANTMFLITKTQYEMRIPIRIQSNGCRRSETSLTVSTDSQKSHVLAIIRLTAQFWPRMELNEPLLQCSQSIITLTPNKWNVIHFRNKSETNLIRLQLKCIRSKRSAEELIRLSSNQLMLAPKQKTDFGLLAQTSSLTDGYKGLDLSVSYDSGFGKCFSLTIPIEVILKK